MNIDVNNSRDILQVPNFIYINKVKKEKNKNKIEKPKNLTLDEIYNSKEHNLKKSITPFKSKNEHINKIILSQKSIGRIEHNKKKFKIIMNKEKNSVMRFAFIDSLKSCCFKRNKGSHNFLITFRKHLLSEEHLFKNHIKIVLLEKKYKIGKNENTNILESYKKL